MSGRRASSERFGGCSPSKARIIIAHVPRLVVDRSDNGANDLLEAVVGISKEEAVRRPDSLYYSRASASEKVAVVFVRGRQGFRF
jgi:hypothetical protein